MEDYIVRATAADGQIRAFAATTKNLVEYARETHDTSPVATAALGRLLTAGAMMGSMMKGERDIITLQIQGSGPLKGIVVTADAKGGVKGYVYEPCVILPANDKGKLDVAKAIGIGLLSVTRDLGLKEPYSSQTNLTTSEIAEDLTYYFATSEQTPSAVALGVLMNKENTVAQSGGFIIQLMPNADEKVVNELESRVQKINSITDLLARGFSPEDILNMVLGDLGVEFTEKTPASFKCNCSKDRVSRAVLSIGKKDLEEIIEEGKDIEVNCHFCNEKYMITVEELRMMKQKGMRQ